MKVAMIARVRRGILVGLAGWLLLVGGPLLAVPTASAAPPFAGPLAGAPGPENWFVAQWYGNTVWSRDNPYQSGQGLHFGIDFNTPCGTAVLAIGDGVVLAVDGPYG